MMKNKNLPWLMIIIGVMASVMAYQVISSRNRKMTDNKELKDTMAFARLHVQVTDAAGETRRFQLGAPVPVSREISFTPVRKSPNAFYMPGIRSQTLEFEGQFTGDVRRGGSCNVDTLCYVPHGLTHLETSAHLLDPDGNPPFVKDIPPAYLNGIVYLIDLTHLDNEPAQTIPWKEVELKLKHNTLPISMLAIKTNASLLPSDYDFSGKDFLALDPAAARGIHDYRFSIPGFDSLHQRIHCLILDLPSIDPEKDNGKLLAHRGFFGLPASGHTGNDVEKRALVELAWFQDLKEGYYYASITPQRFQVNAVATGIIFQPLIEI